MNPSNKTHGLSEHRIYKIWKNMNRRCKDPKQPSYCRYGAKGIGVDWITFEEFLFDMGKSYHKHVKKYGTKETQLDRIDNDKSYSKENCRWATLKLQAENRSTTIWITIKGIKKHVRDWGKEMGVDHRTIHHRLKVGWDPIVAVTKPVGKRYHAKGYTFHNGAYVVNLRINGKYIYLGRYKTPKEATAAHKKFINNY